MLIVKHQPQTPVISLETVKSKLLNEKKGIFCCVYCGRVSILVNQITSGFNNTGCAFRHLSVADTEVSYFTQGSLSEFLSRFGRESENDKEHYHYFETLKEFAEAIIANQWKI